MNPTRCLLAGAMLCSAIALGATQAGAMTIKIAMTVADTSNWVKAANHFKELVAERSGGQHTVEAYPNGVLTGGNDRVELEMAQAGAIEMIMKSTPWLARLDDEFMVISMPWIFPDQETAMAVMDGPAGERLSGLLEGQGLHPLAWGSGSFFQLYTNQGPVKTADDIAGVKIRTPGLGLYLDSWKAVGAVPVAMSFAEVFTALQAGAIDGGISPIPLIYASRFFEVSKNIARINFSFEAIGLIASDAFWQQLSADDQALIRQAAKDAMAYQREVAAGEEAELARKMEEAGVTIQTPSAEELATFKEKVAPVYAEYRDKLGAELVGLVEAEVKKHSGS
jgi:tripartite ATP-independent transporter DctP family solute receptor